MKVFITLLLGMLVSINILIVDASRSMEFPDCNIVAEVVENGVYYDRNSDFYYELEGEIQKKGEDDWSNVRVRNILSDDESCSDRYALGNIFTVDLDEKYEVGSLIIADINFFFDDFGGSYYVENIQFYKSVPRDQEMIAYYKNIFQARLDGNIIDENIPLVLEKIYLLFEKYTQEDITNNTSSQKIISQLRALQELLEEYIDENNT